MASPLPQIDQKLISENFDKRVKRRAVATWYYYTGQARKIYQRQQEGEKQPWRIVRYGHILDPLQYPLPINNSEFTLPKTFAYHLYYLKKNHRIIPLQQLIDEIESGQKISPDTVCITFDGGFRDLYLNAFPLLQKFDIPATVFLPTAFIGTNNLFWPDKITLGMSILSYLAVPFPEFTTLPNNFFDILDRLTQRREITPAAIGLLIDALYDMPPQARVNTVHELGMIINHSAAIPTIENFLTWEMVERINQDRRITFGSMTHSHNAITDLQDDELKQDLQKSQQALSSFRTINSVLSLPYGYEDDQVRLKLSSSGYNYLLSRENKKYSDIQAKPTTLGRVSLFEDASFCTEFLACRLWNINVGKYRF